MEIESILKPMLRAGVQSFKRGIEELDRVRRHAEADVESLFVSPQPREELKKIGRRITALALLGVGGVVSDFAETLFMEKRFLKRYLLSEAGELSQPKEEEFNVQSAALLLGQPNDVSGARSRLAAAFNAQPNQASAIAKGLCLKDAWAPGWLDENRVRVTGTTLAYALAHPGEFAFESNIENLDGLLPEVAVLMESLKAVQRLSCDTPVTVVIAMFGEQAQLPEYIREHIIQLEALRTLNSNFNWRLSLICDGDDSVPMVPAREHSSAEVAKDVIQDAFFDCIKERISILQLSQEEKERIGSKKGGAIIYGMRHALENGAEYIVTNDIDFAFPLLTIGGHLLHLKTTDITIASRWHQETITKRPAIRWGISAIFAGVKALACPELQHVIDTQSAMKGFTAEALKRILPLSADGKWEDGFDYGLSFDTQLLARASMKGLKIKEIRSILYWSQTWGAVPATSGVEMGRRLFIQRALLDDELAQAENALALVAGGYNFHVYTRSDLDVVVKIPKMHSAFEKLYHKALLEFQNAVSPQADTKRLWTHGLMSSPFVLQLKQKLPPIPALLKSALFDAYRLLSPGVDPLAGYRLAAHRLGGLSLEFEIIKDSTFRLVRNAKVESVYVHEAVVQQKIEPQRTVGNLILESADDCKRGQALITQAMAFQETLWRRGVFDRDVTNVLQNLVVIDDNKPRLLDPDDLTSDLDEAIAIVEGESPGLKKRVDVQLLLSLRQELGEYYLRELRRLFTSTHIRDVWDTEEPVPVSPPSGEYPLYETTDKIERLYERLLTIREKRPSPVLRGGDLHENR